ncbi:MAG: SMEK domain-containing protein [Ferruginibacter sp.]
MITSQNLRTLLNRLKDNIGTIKNSVNVGSSVNDLGFNSYLETTVLKLYNITNKVNLINSNLIEKNYPAVDGIDIENKLMVQVTSTFSNKKIEHTVQKIIEHRLYEKYSKLIFISLTDKTTLTKGFKDKIEKMINKRFEFDFDQCILDLDNLYQSYYYKQEFTDIESAVNLLDNALLYKQTDIISGFFGIGVIFHDEEIENAFFITDTIIKEGINVYLTSNKLIARFKESNHPLVDLIIPVTPNISLSNIKFCITILSAAFNIQLQNGRLPQTDTIYSYVIDSGIRIEYVSFDPYMKYYKPIKGIIKSYRNIQINSTVGINKILDEMKSASAYSDIKIEEVKQELINLNSNFAPSVLNEGSSFILLNLKMQSQKDVELNYLILSKDFVLKDVSQKINIKHKIENIKNLNVLVPKDMSQKTRKRLETVGVEFKTDKVEYIDECLFDVRLSKLNQKSILSTADFISPVIKNGEDFLQLNDLVHWTFNNSDSSFAIINGSGGIGKTTVCQKISDMIIEQDERVIVVFIDSERYIDVFGKKGYNGEAEYDIYKIFNACHQYASHFDKNSFYLNCSFGNIVIIFDGIDEIISTIPSFSLFQFLQTVEGLRAGLGKEKILINCRDAYIADVYKFYNSHTDTKIKVYELLGFSEQLAEEFFYKHFDDVDKVKLCLKLVKEFYPDEECKDIMYKYPPFILEIIIQIVDSDFTYQEVDAGFSSDILLNTDKNDLVIYRICNREFIKKENKGFQLPIDQQILFLCELAMEEKGEIKRKDFVRLLEQIQVKDRADNIATGLSDHPLIVNKDDKFTFRLDFFSKYFKSLVIFNMIGRNQQAYISNQLINTIAFDCNFNSVISKTIVKKAKECKIYFGHCLSNTKELIKLIREYGNSHPSYYERSKKSISNLLLMVILSKPENYANEQIVIDLFGNEKKEVENFYLIDIPFFANIIFDFSGFYFSKSEIINYGSFFKCKFDSDTFFDDSCIISQVFSLNIVWKNLAAEPANFHKNIKGDNSLFRVMAFKLDSKTDFSRYFKDYLFAFYKSGQIVIDAIEKDKTAWSDYLKIETIRNILESVDIITKYETGIVYLNERYKVKVYKFVTQGLPFSQLNQAINLLKRFLSSDNSES